MTKFKVEQPKVEQHSFVKGRSGLVYAEYGIIKTYPNKTNAEKRAALLNSLNMLCGVSISWPFTIMPLK